MPSTTSYLHALADCVLSIEGTMRDAGFWHSEVPSPAAMASRTPFCADTLAFSEWLQFVFIPRMRSLIEADGALPGASAIAPLAEESLNERPGKQALVEQLRHFDRLVSGDVSI